MIWVYCRYQNVGTFAGQEAKLSAVFIVPVLIEKITQRLSFIAGSFLPKPDGQMSGPNYPAEGLELDM
jgi:hypothetical protein